jgi:molecular chaperone DnaK (HSP70)
MSEAVYSVGIDLGTTHCVVSYAPLAQEDGEQHEQHLFELPQLVAPGQVESKTALPSFMYLPHNAELTEEQRTLPWDVPDFVTGRLSRELGSKTPNRLISSAKSWLGHGKVDRRSALLPLQAPADVEKHSPFDATRIYLEHIKDAWDTAFPEHPLTEQQVTITVPASFDPSARDLTGEAAKSIGLGHATLLEEPQAALYSWIALSNGDWRNQVKVGEVILVVDLGGGTTDLSLIVVTEEDGNLQLNRIAVGDHLLLGGDNMDLALANLISQKLAREGTRLQPWQLLALAHGCRDAKELLFSDAEISEVPIVVPSRGSDLFGGSLRTELTRDEMQQVLLEGFFPRVDVSDPVIQRSRTALTTMSLPYAQDPAITRHIGAFLTKQLHAVDSMDGVQLPEEAMFLHPSAILFNGGVVKADGIRQRIEETMNAWLAADGAEPVKVLTGIEPDQAVARGAAYYGCVRNGKGVRIRGGTACSYYVGIESALPAVPGMEPPLEALCIAPFGMEEGTEAEPTLQEFGLIVGEPVRFRFFSSTVRRQDEAGTVLDFWDEGELEELPPIEATLTADGRTPGEVAAVLLQASINELGTLSLNAIAVGGEGIWQVEFDTRGQQA